MTAEEKALLYDKAEKERAKVEKCKKKANEAITKGNYAKAHEGITEAACAQARCNLLYEIIGELG